MNVTTLTVDATHPTIVITRWFDAPRRLVFEACTKPELLKRWWGPRDTRLVVCEVDLRPGGAWRFVLQAADGQESGFSGVYREIVPDERIVQTFIYDPFPDADALETSVLEAHGDRTKLSVTIVHKTMWARDGHVGAGMERGMRETHDRLEELLRSQVGVAKN